MIYVKTKIIILSTTKLNNTYHVHETEVFSVDFYFLSNFSIQLDKMTFPLINNVFVVLPTFSFLLLIFNFLLEFSFRKHLFSLQLNQ